MPSKGERTRSAILEKALDLFEKKGAHEVLLREIGKPLRLAPATVHKHFPSRDVLIEACCREGIQRARSFVDERIPENDPAERKLRHYIHANFLWVTELRRELHVLLTMYYLGLTSKFFRDLHAEIDQISVARIESLLIQGVREGAWSPQECAPLARALHSLLVGEMIKAYREENSFSAESRTRAFWKIAKKLVQAPA